jgi:preprotein translocase subunit SecE
MKRRKIIKALWVVISFIVVLSMVAWSVAIGF